MAYPLEMMPFLKKLRSLLDVIWTGVPRWETTDTDAMSDIDFFNFTDYLVYHKSEKLLVRLRNRVNILATLNHRLMYRSKITSESDLENCITHLIKWINLLMYHSKITSESDQEKFLTNLIKEISQKIVFAEREVTAMESYYMSFSCERCLDECVNECYLTVDAVLCERLQNIFQSLAFTEEDILLCAPITTLPAAKKVVSSETKECSNCAMVEGEGVTLRGCSRCKVVFYCGKVCQTQHWKQGGHKRYCVAVSERTVGSTQSAAATDNDCSICLEEMTSESGVTSMSCGHALHARCLKDFSETFGKIIKCPVCRATHRP